MGKYLLYQKDMPLNPLLIYKKKKKKTETSLRKPTGLGQIDFYSLTVQLQKHFYWCRKVLSLLI